MSQAREIDYEGLIDRSIKSFEPARRFWPISLKLVLWILLEASILALGAGSGGFNGLLDLLQRQGHPAGALIVMSAAAAFLALRSSIPGREITSSELLLLAVGLCVAFTIGFETFAHPLIFPDFSQAGLVSVAQPLGLAALPAAALFCAVRRGVPLQPIRTGAMIGIAAFCFGIAAWYFISPPEALPGPIIWQVVSGVVFAAASALAGALWLRPEHQWQQERPAAGVEKHRRPAFGTVTAFPVAITISIIALIFALNSAGTGFTRVPDFDLAIASYEQSLANFRPNVPSSSIETVLTAYVEHGMPSYMWDFDRDGFKLVGGRWEHLPDGTPVTYTWFSGAKGGVMCMFRQTDGFNPPSVPHEKHHHLLFYKYRGFSVCLINVGGYGNFIGVIVAPIPMKQFVSMVLAATV